MTAPDWAGLLAAVDLPLEMPVAAADWPIGAAMLQFPGRTAGGATIREAGPDRWFRDLTVIAAEGFSSVEIPSTWLPIADMTPTELDTLRSVLHQAGLAICATSVVRQSVMHPTAGHDNLAATHRAIDATAALGSTMLCLGLHDKLTPRQLEVLWFWTVPGTRASDDRDAFQRAAALYRELADHAASAGVQISLEMYEDLFLGTADGAIEFLDEIARPNVGLNPDLGNLVRAQKPIEAWEAMAVKTLPLANYWHVKNYARAEDPGAGVYLTTPTPLPSGVINYRAAVAFAIANGFRGAFLCENYGGDGLTVSGENHRYLRRLLTSFGAQ